MLEVKNLHLKMQEKEIIKGISMKFENGKKYGILGTNGAGKSSIAYVLMGREDYSPTKGDILIDDQSILNLSINERAKLGLTLLWQEPARFTGINIKNYLTLGGRIKASREEIEEVMEFVKLSPKIYLSRSVDKSLSGGERKRIEMASILLLKPKYAILDEPDSGIDIMSLELINDLMNKITSWGGTVIVITHREEIAKNTDNIYLICDGKILKEGKPSEMISYFKNSCDNCDHTNIITDMKVGEAS